MMTTVSPPKPWERGGSAVLSAAASTTTPSSASLPSTTPTTDPSSSSSSAAAAPALPSRPSTLTSVVNQTASNYSAYGQSRLGASPYGGYGGYSSYSSPYSRFGTVGSMYGGYGGMYGGMNGIYGGGYGGMPGQPNDPNSLTNSFNQSTQATFQIIESIVGAFGGFAQMLDSTYMATHSSFLAMVSVAEQFGNLRNTLGSVLGIFALLRWIRTLIAKLTGRPPPADATSLTPAAFASFLHPGQSAATPKFLPEGSPAPPRPSKKPLIMFALAVFGLPYLMGKLIKALASNQEAEAARRQQEGTLLAQGQGEGPLDPRTLTFCRALFDYIPGPDSPSGLDLSVKQGDMVAVLSKTDPMGNPSEWWRCRARDGNVGYLPSPYLEVIPRRPTPAITAGGAPGSRTTTLKGSGADSRTESLSSVAGPVSAEGKGKAGNVGVEEFQKSAFYS